jgi:hypothetical protein
MKINFADSFSKSLEKLIWHQSPIYKFYEIFRYKIPMFLKNLWFFRKEIWEFRSWDYSFNLMMLRRSLEKTVNTIEFVGHEIQETRTKKVEKMKRAIELLEHIRSDSYIEMAEKELGELKRMNWDFEELPDRPGFSRLVDNDNPDDVNHNRKVYKRADEIEAEEWKELWKILEGQDHLEYKKIVENATEEEKLEKDLWIEWFDGSGMKHWWD